jgi:hypothetical protein
MAGVPGAGAAALCGVCSFLFPRICLGPTLGRESVTLCVSPDSPLLHDSLGLPPCMFLSA